MKPTVSLRVLRTHAWVIGVVTLVALSGLCSSRAYAAHHGEIMISDARIGATPPAARVAAGYLSMHNMSKSDDRLIGATASFAGEVELHETTVENDVAKMRQLPDGVALAPGEQAMLAPGGLHMMFMQLDGALVEGDSVSVTLQFEVSGEQEVEFKIVAPGAGHGMQKHGSGAGAGHKSR